MSEDGLVEHERLLARALARGNADRATEFAWALHHVGLATRLRLRGLETADQEEILQETFALFWERCAAMRAREVRTWLFATCEYHQSNWTRLRDRREAAHQRLDPHQDPRSQRPNIDSLAIDQGLQRAIDALAPADRIVFYAGVVEGCSTVEIRLRLVEAGHPEPALGTLRMRKLRVNRFVANHLQAREGHD